MGADEPQEAVEQHRAAGVAQADALLPHLPEAGGVAAGKRHEGLAEEVSDQRDAQRRPECEFLAEHSKDMAQGKRGNDLLDEEQCQDGDDNERRKRLQIRDHRADTRLRAISQMMTATTAILASSIAPCSSARLLRVAAIAPVLLVRSCWINRTVAGAWRLAATE